MTEPFRTSAKIMPKGQVTLPIEIRKLLNVSPGDRITFSVQGNSIIIKKEQSFTEALEEFQKAMKGEAEKAGLHTEEDVVNLIHEIRHKSDD